MPHHGREAAESWRRFETAKPIHRQTAGLKAHARTGLAHWLPETSRLLSQSKLLAAYQTKPMCNWPKKPFSKQMKKLVIILASLIASVIFVLSNLFIFAPRFDSEEIAGFRYPVGSELLFRKRDSPYKIYKWRIPQQHFSSIVSPSGVEKSPFHAFEWSKREYVKFSDGADKLLNEGDIAWGSESIHYRTSHHAVELIRSPTESTITVISIYNN